MSSTSTPYLALVMPTPGQMANTWGTVINTNFSKLDTQASADNANITTNRNNIAANTSAITTLQTSDAGQSSSISALQSQMTTANANIASNTSAIATFNGSLATLQAQLNAAVGASPAGPSNNITTNAGNIGTLQGQMTTANNNIAANSSAITFLQSLIQTINGFVSWKDYTVNSGTMQGKWISFRWAPVSGNTNVGLEIAFGYGTGQQGDTIVLPQSGGTAWNWYAMMSLQNAPIPVNISNIVLLMSGLTLQDCYVLGSNQTNYNRGWVTAYWQAIAYRVTS